eukprot:1158940-Pelagomonas_calceolata.AAC.6
MHTVVPACHHGVPGQHSTLVCAHLHTLLQALRFTPQACSRAFPAHWLGSSLIRMSPATQTTPLRCWTPAWLCCAFSVHVTSHPDRIFEALDASVAVLRDFAVSPITRRELDRCARVVAVE